MSNEQESNSGVCRTAFRNTSIDHRDVNRNMVTVSESREVRHFIRYSLHLLCRQKTKETILHMERIIF